MLAQAVVRPVDLDDHCVVKQAIQEGRGDHCAAEHLAPLGEAADHGPSF